MYCGIALMAYMFTMDYLQGGTLASDCGLTTKEASDALYWLHEHRVVKEGENGGRHESKL